MTIEFLALLGLAALAGFILVRARAAARSSDRIIVTVPEAFEARRRCPKCHEGQMHRSKARNVWERLVRSVSPRRLFRCDRCDWRGWLEVVETAGGPMPPSAGVDLSAIDADQKLRRSKSRRRRGNPFPNP